MVSLIKEDIEEEEDQCSNNSLHKENCKENDESEQVDEDDKYFNRFNQQKQDNLNDFSFESEINDNDQEVEYQQRLIDNLRKEQYFENNNQVQRQKFYSVSCFIPEDEQEHNLSSSEYIKEEEYKQNQSINSEITQISVNEEEIQIKNESKIETKIQNTSNTSGLEQVQQQQEYEQQLQQEVDRIKQANEQSMQKGYLNKVIELLDNKEYTTNRQLVEEMTYVISNLTYFQNIFNQEQIKDEDIKNVCECLKIHRINKKQFLFQINDDSDYLYILLDGCMAVYVPKSDQEIDQEIKMKYNALQNAKIINNVITIDSVQQVIAETKIKLTQLKEQKEQVTNQYHEDFLKDSSNYSQMYFKYESQLCSFKRANVLKPGDVFGNLALAKNKNRTASVIAMTDCVLVKIQGWQYTKFLKREQEKREFLSKCMRSIFSTQKNNQKLEGLPYLFNEVSYQRNQAIYRSNDINSFKFYFILRGSVEILKNITEKEGVISQYQDKLDKFMQNKVRKYNQNREICALVIGPGEFFGHEDLYEMRPRTYTAQSASSETIVFEIERSIIDEINSPKIIQILRELGKLRIERCEERIKQIQQFKQEMSTPKSLNAEISNSIQKLAKDKIIQNSLTYSYKMKENQKENNDINIPKENPFYIEIDPSKNKRMILGDALDFQKAKQQIQRRVSNIQGQKSKNETYYQKNNRPDQIQDFNSCLQYIKTVPSFSHLKSKSNLPSLKESIQIFEEEKLKFKAEQFKKFQRGRNNNIDEQKAPRYQQNLSNSCQDISSRCNNENENNNNNTDIDVEDIPKSPHYLQQIIITESPKIYDKKNQMAIPIINSFSEQIPFKLGQNIHLNKQMKHPIESYIHRRFSLNQLSNKNNQVDQIMSYNNQSKQIKESKDGGISCFHNIQNQTQIKKRLHSLSIMNHQEQQVLKKHQSHESQIKQNQINTVNKQEENNYLLSQIKGQSLTEKLIKNGENNRGILDQIQYQNNINQIKSSPSIQSFQNEIISQTNYEKQNNKDMQIVMITCDSKAKQMDETQHQQSEENQNQKSLSEEKVIKNEIKGNKAEIAVKNNDKIHLNLCNSPSIKFHKETDNLINQKLHSDKPYSKIKRIQRRHLSESHIQNKIKIEEMAILLSPQSKLTSKQIYGESFTYAVKNNSKREQEYNSSYSSTNTNQTNQLNSPINLISKNDSSKKIFVEDSFTVQSYKSLASNSQLKNKILHLPIVDEGEFQRQDTNYQTKTISTVHSKESIEPILDPKYEVKNQNCNSRIHAQVLKSPRAYYPKRTSLILPPCQQDNSNATTLQKKNQLGSNTPHSLKNINPYIQSVIFPDFKYTNPLFLKIKQNQISEMKS